MAESATDRGLAERAPAVVKHSAPWAPAPGRPPPSRSTGRQTAARTGVESLYGQNSLDAVSDRDFAVGNQRRASLDPGANLQAAWLEEGDPLGREEFSFRAGSPTVAPPAAA